MSKIITLISDFGLADEYVGVMKGVILSRSPGTVIVDISHEVQRHDILQAALVLNSAYSYFPKGSVHLVVVDPGVGSSRRLILLKADGHLFLAPDNGVLSFVIEKNKFEVALDVQCQQLYLSPVSSSFHGRDILAPVAAELAKGFEAAEVGPVVKRETLIKIKIPLAVIDTGNSKISAEIIAVDHFGNLITNIRENILKELQQQDKSKTLAVRLKNETITGIKNSYAEVTSGELLANIGSKGFLEIAVNQGSAASFLKARVGDIVEVKLIPE